MNRHSRVSIVLLLLLQVIACATQVAQAFDVKNPPFSTPKPLHFSPANNAQGRWMQRKPEKRPSLPKSSQCEASYRISLLRAGATGGAEKRSKLTEKVANALDKNFFLFGMFVVVLGAKAFPMLGVDKGLVRPELFIGKFGVAAIFFLSGLALQTSELNNAISDMKLNGLIQTAIFVLWPFLIGAPLASVLRNGLPGLLPPPLIDGLLIMSCLPTTVNMCIMLTSATGGNVATSICNAVISNTLGIFVTPALLLHFFGTTIKLPFLAMVGKLCKKVLLPVAIGQACRSTPIKDVYSNHAKSFKRLQEIILLGIVWNAFCNAFTGGLGLKLQHSVVLMGLLPVLHLGSFGILLKFFTSPFLNISKRQAIAASFCSSQKTLAFGLPLIKAIFEGNPNLAAYCAPLMFIHPLQMTLGSLMIPSLTKFAKDDDSKRP